MTRADSEYLRFDPFQGDEADIRCRSVKLVRVRKEHPCFLGAHPIDGDQHTIKPGERARVESALIDGDFWGRSYVCLPCMDQWLVGLLDGHDSEDDE